MCVCAGPLALAFVVVHSARSPSLHPSPGDGWGCWLPLSFFAAFGSQANKVADASRPSLAQTGMRFSHTTRTPPSCLLAPEPLAKRVPLFFGCSLGARACACLPSSNPQWPKHTLLAPLLCWCPRGAEGAPRSPFVKGVWRACERGGWVGALSQQQGQNPHRPNSFVQICPPPPKTTCLPSPPLSLQVCARVVWLLFYTVAKTCHLFPLLLLLLCPPWCLCHIYFLYPARRTHTQEGLQQHNTSARTLTPLTLSPLHC
jgi:hypothetical protein